jgi:hypothetical protein
MVGFSTLKIFSDTNIIHVKNAHQLIERTVAEYILEHRRIESVELKWMLPGMVVEERKHQMLQEARSLMPNIGKLESLIGHSLALSDDILKDRIESKISKTLDEYQVEVIDLVDEDVDWKNIISRSSKRLPPFEMSGEKEKGFRDAIIAETFFQEVGRSPTTPRNCLLVMVTGDKRLNDYICERTSELNNVRVFESLDKLKAFLNIVASEVEEAFVKELEEKANKVFWDYDKSDGLYSKEKIYTKLTSDFSKEDSSTLLDEYENSYKNITRIMLDDLSFIKKVKQTVTWSKLVRFEYEIRQRSSIKSESLKSKDNEDVVVAMGSDVYQVVWQHQISTKNNIRNAKVIDVNYIGDFNKLEH